MFKLQSEHKRRQTLKMTKNTRVDGPKAQVEIPDPWQKKINDFTRQGNQWIAEQWGLPLQEYGYPL
jgi:hypothetical protein